jgi:hypothetical protein
LIQLIVGVGYRKNYSVNLPAIDCAGGDPTENNRSNS